MRCFILLPLKSLEKGKKILFTSLHGFVGQVAEFWGKFSGREHQEFSSVPYSHRLVQFPLQWACEEQSREHWYSVKRNVITFFSHCEHANTNQRGDAKFSRPIGVVGALISGLESGRKWEEQCHVPGQWGFKKSLICGSRNLDYLWPSLGWKRISKSWLFQALTVNNAGFPVLWKVFSTVDKMIKFQLNIGNLKWDL